MMEIHKEVGNALREKSLIGNVFNKIEGTTKIKRMVIIYAVAVITTLLFLLNFFGARATQFITTVWPILGSLRAMDMGCQESQRKWLGYWIIYVLINSFNFVFVNTEKHFKRIYILKVLILVFCAIPSSKCGAVLVSKLLANKIFKDTGGAPSAPSAPSDTVAPMMTTSQKKDDLDKKDTAPTPTLSKKKKK